MGRGGPWGATDEALLCSTAEGATKATNVGHCFKCKSSHQPETTVIS